MIHKAITPDEYRAGLKKLWDALPQRIYEEDDVFTLASQRIKWLTEVLESIAMQGTDMPAVNIDEAGWYRQIAYRCIGRARRGLDA